VHQHGIGRVAEFVMADDDAEALDDALGAPATDTFKDLALLATDTTGEHRKRPHEQRQAFLQSHHQPAFELVERPWRHEGLPAHRRRQAFLAFAVERKTEVDVIFLQQGQAQQRLASRLLDGPQSCLQAAFGTGGDNEPEVVAMLALVVVVDLRKAIDRLGDGGQFLRRYSHRRQRAGTNALGRKDGADAGDFALATQRLEQAQDGVLSHTKALPDFSERCRAKREVPLEVVQQTKVERLVGHCDLRIPCAAHGW
jgi:hypothetical protein